MSDPTKPPAKPKARARKAAAVKPPNDLSPHPLVVGLAATMFGQMSIAEAHDEASKADNQQFGFMGAHEVAEPEPPAEGRMSTQEAVATFVKARNRWELVKFVGYLADRIKLDEDPENDGPWQVLFLDDTAESYVIIRYKDIKFHERVEHEGAAFGKIDMLWVKAESRVATGGRMEPLLARFTTGGFMRAGDFRSSMTGGTFASASDLGPLCTAFTPCCCTRKSP